MSNINLQNKNDSTAKQQELLQRQRDSQDKISALLEKSADALLCGPECQKQKISEELKQKYLNAQTNIQTAPINLENTKKNFYIYTEGRPFYDNKLEEELKQKSEKIGSLISESFNDEVSSAKTMNEYYNIALINSSYTKELLNHYLEQNKELKLKLRDNRGDILTNDRKTFYENEALTKLEFWYKIWWYIYYLLIIIFILAIFLSQSQLSLMKKTFILVLLLFYPYYIDYLTTWIYGSYTNFKNNLPKSVYNNL